MVPETTISWSLLLAGDCLHLQTCSGRHMAAGADSSVGEAGWEGGTLIAPSHPPPLLRQKKKNDG